MELISTIKKEVIQDINKYEKIDINSIWILKKDLREKIEVYKISERKIIVIFNKSSYIAEIIEYKNYNKNKLGLMLNKYQDKNYRLKNIIYLEKKYWYDKFYNKEDIKINTILRTTITLIIVSFYLEKLLEFRKNIQNGKTKGINGEIIDFDKIYRILPLEESNIYSEFYTYLYQKFNLEKEYNEVKSKIEKVYTYKVNNRNIFLTIISILIGVISIFYK